MGLAEKNENKYNLPLTVSDSDIICSVINEDHVTKSNIMKIKDLSNALEILGSSDADPIARLQETLLEQAAEKLLVEIDDEHPDHPEEAAKLAAEIEALVEAREEIHAPVEGWDYWFGDSTNFRAYKNALKLFSLDA